MIENHKWGDKLREQIKNGADGNKCAETEIKAVIDYSQQFNTEFPPMSTIEAIYMLFGAKTCINTMLDTLLKKANDPIVTMKAAALEQLCGLSIDSTSIFIPVSKGEEK